MAESDVVVTRQVELDVPPDQLWGLVADGSRWAEWLAAEAEVDVAPGADGNLVDDDGIARRVRIDRVDPAGAVRFTWWPADEPELVSTVELVVLPRPGGSRLQIREVLAGASAARAVTSVRAWDIRALVLWSTATAVPQPV